MFAGFRSIRPSRRMGVAVGINAGLLGLIGYSFWVTDWQYSLPTPRPDGLVQMPVGSRPNLAGPIAALRREDHPLLIHFANPHCPCTEFNLDHIRMLQQQFGATVDFVTVLESSADPAGTQREFESMHLRMPVVADGDGALAATLGVYGTPQAVLLDDGGRLYFRGNYNRSRYCNDESSEYVRLALNALIAGQPPGPLPPEATIAFGCPLLRRAEANGGAVRTP